MDKRREEIINVALMRFGHYGFSKTTMNEIAEDLHISKANLYYYYQDKTALINDVIRFVADGLFLLESDLIKNYKHNFLGTLFEILELRSSFLSKYYMLHINENLEWLKGIEISGLFKELNQREIIKLTDFFEKAVAFGDVLIDNIEEAVFSFYEVNKALGVMYNFQDILSGIPNKSNVDLILKSQKRVTKLMFQDKIVNK